MKNLIAGLQKFTVTNDLVRRTQKGRRKAYGKQLLNRKL